MTISNREDLPDCARKFIESKRSEWSYDTCYRTYTPLCHFHAWLEKEEITIGKLRGSDIKRFVAVCNRKDIRKESLRVLLSNICIYLDWLKKEGIISEIPLDEVFPHSHIVTTSKLLPYPAPEFISVIGVNLSENSVTHYRDVLRTFYRLLKSRKVDLKELNRGHLEIYFKHLYDRGASAASRIQRLILLRVYLRWLYEHEFIDTDSERLIKITDFPKMPQYLPRPLPPKIDRELQRRLSESNFIYDKALLLMRRTGIRISELIQLHFECIQEDPTGNKYLKIELGKLKNERLVPMNSGTVELVESLRKESFLNYIKYNDDVYPKRLLVDPKNRTNVEHFIKKALLKATEGLETKEPITSHRLRHSFATNVLSGGASIFTVMRLLGHRHFAMTLRYAEVTPEAIRTEFFAAVEKIDLQYKNAFAEKSFDFSSPEPVQTLPDLAKWIQSSAEPLSERQKLLYSRRTKKLYNDLKGLLEKSR